MRRRTCPPVRRIDSSKPAPHVRLAAERLESRCLLSFASAANDTGAVVTSLTEVFRQQSAAIIVSFSGAMDPVPAQNVGNYAVNGLAGGNPEFVTTDGPSIPIRSATYNRDTNQVTLDLSRPLRPGVFYRVFISGAPGTGLVGTNGVSFDGDNDATASGNFFGLIAGGSQVNFTDMSGDRATVKVSAPATVEVWRELDGNVNQLSVLGAVLPDRTALTGSVRPAPGSPGVVVIPSTRGLDGVNNELPPSFVSQPPPPFPSPPPVVATAQNLAYTLQVTPVPITTLPTIQAAVYAQSGGDWLIFGGRSNGLHNFSPNGKLNFPPDFQNNNVIVINPATGQTWIEPWSETGLPASVTTSLSSATQSFYQVGDRLYTVGGYSFNATTNQFTTYDTFSAISVSGLVNAVINHTSAAGTVKQIHDPRLAIAGGGMSTIGNRTYLVFGQDFQGGYTGATTGTASLFQIYSDENRSFQIIDKGNVLAIRGYRAQRDPVNFRRRDYNLDPSILPTGQQGLTVFGGVFTPEGNGYRNPVLIGPNGTGVVDTHYQQYFSQYNTANAPLYDARTHSMYTIFFGGIGLYDYNFGTGTLAEDPQLPWVDDVTSLVQRPGGATQEYIMPSQLPGRYGAYAAFFTNPGLPEYSNGVIKLAQLHGPTTLGYIYGGIFSKVGETTVPALQSSASNRVFKVTLTPS